MQRGVIFLPLAQLTRLNWFSAARRPSNDQAVEQSLDRRDLYANLAKPHP